MASGTPHPYYSDVLPVPPRVARYERARYRHAHLWVQCFAEALGTFLYCFCGIGSQAGYVVGTITNKAGVSSVLQIGIAYAVGIVLALVIAAPTSGGHFNPCVTIAQVVFRGFPLRKAPFYIIAQILGAFVACLVVYLQYKNIILQLEEGLSAAGLLTTLNFTPQGPAGIFGLYAPVPSALGQVWWNEFSCDFVLGLAIWAVIDPTNLFAPPAVVPWVVGFTYATVIWGFSPVGLAANSARDIGARLMVLCIWGPQAAGGSYAAIAALTNIPAMLLAAGVYEFVLRDVDRIVPHAQQEFYTAMHAHTKRKEEQMHAGSMMGGREGERERSADDLESPRSVMRTDVKE